ncbi:phasin family protein [Novosphingobium colocasiae]|uniref:phasin family protein n=1 Tax=Novosphingobium colocasiae TaxID=1256513 RepID=UPI0035B14ECF
MVDKDKVTGSAKKAVPAGRSPRKAPAAKKAVVAKAPAVPAAQPVAAKPAPVAKVAAAVAKPTPPVAAPVPVKAEKPAKPAAIKAAVAVPAKIPAPAEIAPPAAPAPVPAVAAAIVPPVPKAAPKTVPTEKPRFAGLSFNLFSEDRTMDFNANFSGMQDAITEAQTKAKAAFDKSTSVLGEVSDFTKGNVEALIESGKILAEGVQGLGTEIVSESRSAFETLTGDIKELAAAKSPTDFFKLQGDLVRKNFDSAVAYGSKSSETMLKLASDVIAPISSRVSLAMEKARTISV